MRYSTEYVSDKYLHVNSCYVQYIYDRNTHTVRPTGRKDYLILYIAEGYCHACVDGKRQCIEAGNLIVYKPDEPQDYAFNAADRSVLCSLHFTGTGCETLLSDMYLNRTSVLYVGTSKKILSVFEKTAREYALKTPEYQSFCDAYLYELYASVKRQFAYRDNPEYIKNNTLINDVCRLMYNEYAENVPVERYAEFCHLSVSRFAHIFKSCTGEAPLAYIMRIRIEKAIYLMVNTDWSVSEIAQISGFSSQNYFGRIFKRHTGTTPKKFILENRA